MAVCVHRPSPQKIVSRTISSWMLQTGIGANQLGATVKSLHLTVTSRRLSRSFRHSFPLILIYKKILFGEFSVDPATESKYNT